MQCNIIPVRIQGLRLCQAFCSKKVFLSYRKACPTYKILVWSLQNEVHDIIVYRASMSSGKYAHYKMNGLNLKSICLSETMCNFPNNLRPYGSFPSTFVNKIAIPQVFLLCAVPVPKWLTDYKMTCLSIQWSS